MDKEKYKLAFMDMALRFALTSEANRLQVGCLIVRDGQIISQGVNGTPVGWNTNCCEGEDGLTYWFVKHAEVQALNKLRNSTFTAKGSVMYVSHSPCKNCALEIIDAGISKVYYHVAYRDRTGIDLLNSYGIEVEQLGGGNTIGL